MLEKKYFPACNSKAGFVNFFDDIFNRNDITKLFIIKGGPGTGKSKLIRDVSKEAINKNYNVEYFYCSSDPDSLDGLIINDLKIGILDGTSPHLLDPSLPGARDELINLGDFWKSDALFIQKNLISQLFSSKASLYNEVYHMLAIADLIDSESKCVASDTLDFPKLSNALLRLSKTFIPGSGFSVKPRLLNSIGMNGFVSFNSFYESASNHFIIKDKHNVSHIIFRELLKFAQDKKQPALLSFSPLNTDYIDAILLPEINTSFTLGNQFISPSDKIINSDRFIIPSLLHSAKQKLHFLSLSHSSILNFVLHSFNLIHSIHFELENIYSSAMDFKRKEDFTKKLLIKIFK